MRRSRRRRAAAAGDPGMPRLPTFALGTTTADGVMGHRPELQQAWENLKGAFAGPSATLSPHLKEEVRRTLAQRTGCRFCASMGQCTRASAGPARSAGVGGRLAERRSSHWRGPPAGALDDCLGNASRRTARLSWRHSASWPRASSTPPRRSLLGAGCPRSLTPRRPPSNPSGHAAPTCGTVQTVRYRPRDRTRCGCCLGACKTPAAWLARATGLRRDRFGGNSHAVRAEPTFSPTGTKYRSASDRSRQRRCGETNPTTGKSRGLRAKRTLKQARYATDVRW
jgi:hypothetical protein